MTAEGRHEAMLWGEGAVVLAPIAAHLMIEHVSLEESYLAEDTARMDDAHWQRRADGPWAGWQAFTNWWVARRWVKPRDITKE